MKPPSRRERLVGVVSMQVLAYLAKAALRRGDRHEAEHVAAALRAGDTSPEGHVEPCIARPVLLVHRPSGADA